jgi:hypothetical protein
MACKLVREVGSAGRSVAVPDAVPVKVLAISSTVIVELMTSPDNGLSGLL